MSAELPRAANLAGQARHTLDARQHQARSQAERDRQREADQPSPARWPHRDPGYDYDAMLQRQAGRTPARLAALDFPVAVPDLTAASIWASSGTSRSGAHRRQLERDEPEAAL